MWLSSVNGFNATLKDWVYLWTYLHINKPNFMQLPHRFQVCSNQSEFSIALPQAITQMPGKIPEGNIKGLYSLQMRSGPRPVSVCVTISGWNTYSSVKLPACVCVGMCA